MRCLRLRLANLCLGIISEAIEVVRKAVEDASDKKAMDII